MRRRRRPVNSGARPSGRRPIGRRLAERGLAGLAAAKPRARGKPGVLTRLRVLIGLGVLLGLCALGLAAPVPAVAAEGGQAWKIGLAIGRGGLPDRSFNDMQFTGIQIAARKYGITYEIGLPSREKGEDKVLEDLLARGCDVILAGSWDYQEALDRLARRHPRTLFVLFDAPAKAPLPNVASIVFRQNEASYLAGVLAAGISQTGVVGLIGGEDHPVIRDFIAGFEAGARLAKPDVKILTRFISAVAGDNDPWNSPLIALGLAASLYRDERCDVIFAVASGSNRGVIKAAQDAERYVIGADSDQDHLAPGLVLTSVMKRLDTAVVLTVEKILAGAFQPGEHFLGLAEGGVSLSPLTYSRLLIPEPLLARLETLRQGIVSGAVRVPSALR